MENNLKKYITVLLDVHLKLTQYCKSTIFQLTKRGVNKRSPRSLILKQDI